MYKLPVRVQVCPLDWGVAISCVVEGVGVYRCYGDSERYIEDAKSEVHYMATKEVYRDLPVTKP